MTRAAWALDLGTSNTSIARWDPAADRPRLLELHDLCRVPGGDDHLEAPRLVPSAVHLLEPDGLWARLGAWGPLRRRLWGHQGLIGRPALDKNAAAPHAAFAPTFKTALSRAPLTPLARLGRRTFTARDVARVFLRELLIAVRAATGERIRDLVITAPVDAYESYRAELQRLARDLGITRLRFLDEPVAAAIGYGLGQQRRRHALVVDFGAGTVNVALVALDARMCMPGIPPRIYILRRYPSAAGAIVLQTT